MAMMVITAIVVGRAGQLARLMVAGAAVMFVCLIPATAQPTTPAGRPLDAASFLRLAHSSAVLQAKAAQVVASREARPEARAFAQTMVDFRREQLPKLEAALREHQLAVPSVQEFEHQVILDNLEPLNFLALSRRYAEIQVQALEQEVRGYGSGENSSEDWLKRLAADIRPRLQQLLEEARQMHKAVGP
jgi:predicted outer membrane protein